MYIIFFQSYLTIIYVNYFIPGSLKLQYKVYKIDFRDFVDTSLNPLLFQTRRWLQKGEAPFPGYCRAPGSGACLPILCNCKTLLEIWTKINDTKSKLKGVAV